MSPIQNYLNKLIEDWYEGQDAINVKTNITQYYLKKGLNLENLKDSNVEVFVEPFVITNFKGESLKLSNIKLDIRDHVENTNFRNVYVSFNINKEF